MWGATETCAKGQKSRVFRSLILSVLLYFCKFWTLPGELKRRLNFNDTISFRQVFGIRYQDYTSSDLVLREAGLRHVTCIVRERQLRFYGHVA